MDLNLWRFIGKTALLGLGLYVWESLVGVCITYTYISYNTVLHHPVTNPPVWGGGPEEEKHLAVFLPVKKPRARPPQRYLSSTHEMKEPHNEMRLKSSALLLD